MEPKELVEKLIRLATNNPNEEEATAAALRAVRLIAEHQILIGGKTMVAPLRAPLTPEEQTEFKDILSSLATINRDEFKPATVYATTEIDDEFMKKRIVEAWRKIREQRAQLASEIARYERETHRKFDG